MHRRLLRQSAKSNQLSDIELARIKTRKHKCLVRLKLKSVNIRRDGKPLVHAFEASRHRDRRKPTRIFDKRLTQIELVCDTGLDARMWSVNPFAIFPVESRSDDQLALTDN